MPAPRGLVQQVDQGLHRSGLLPRGGKLLVAVSGGADSVALLRLLVEINRSDYWKWKLVVGHVDHGMRGEASRGDARFVKELAGELGVRFVMKRLALRKGTSEGMAREGRLKALSAMVRGKGLGAVVMGHHAEDQAETMLMRMMRGCGLEGLAGMGTESVVGEVRVIRPLLQVRRAALREYLNELGQSWREDATNAEGDYLRNRVRLELMPVVERLWPTGVEALGRLGELARAVQEFVGECFVEMMEDMPWRHTGKGIMFFRSYLRQEDPLLVGELLRGVVEMAGGSREVADFERIGEAVRLIMGRAGKKRIQMGRGIEVVLEQDEVRLEGIGKGIAKALEKNGRKRKARGG